ncbi:hypothetical protein QBC41DRAFT_282136 [Cercophora samala]|uniref:Uncharacterized protein n=1 Tax=Cercophora samala TaxID=330535 RepID=A0AA40D8P2_9PEZI|nr:hypothetical protein QBC41DRAFT_282136 [Cercophora samala]
MEPPPPPPPPPSSSLSANHHQANSTTTTTTSKLRQLVSSVHRRRHVKTNKSSSNNRSTSLLTPSSDETSASAAAEPNQSDLHRCLATVNSFSNHLGELRALWEQHGHHLLASRPESRQRVGLVMQKAKADIEHCEKILHRCSLANLDHDSETRLWRRLRWALVDRHKFEHHLARAERNDNAITTHIFALHHLLLDRAVSKLLLDGGAAREAGPGTDVGGSGSPVVPPANAGLAVPRVVVTRPGLPASPRPVRGVSTPPPPPRPAVGSVKGKQQSGERGGHIHRPLSEPPLRPEPPPPLMTMGRGCCTHAGCHGKKGSDLGVEEEKEEEQEEEQEEEEPAPRQQVIDVDSSRTTLITTDFTAAAAAAAPPASALQQARGLGGRGLGGPCCSKGENIGGEVGGVGVKLVH